MLLEQSFIANVQAFLTANSLVHLDCGDGSRVSVNDVTLLRFGTINLLFTCGLNVDDYDKLG